MAITSEAMPEGRRILRWDVPFAATAAGRTVKIGEGPVVMCAWREHRQLGSGQVEVWTDEAEGLRCTQDREVVIVGTGHEVPEGGIHIGSCVAGEFVWHVYQV
jgi:hypothetical protein